MLVYAYQLFITARSLKYKSVTTVYYWIIHFLYCLLPLSHCLLCSIAWSFGVFSLFTQQTKQQTNKNNNNKTLVAGYARHQCVKWPPPPGRDITITYPLSQDILSNILFIMWYCLITCIYKWSMQVSHYKKLFVCCYKFLIEFLSVYLQKHGVKPYTYTATWFIPI